GQAAEDPAAFDTLLQAWRLVRERFIDRDDIDVTSLEYAAIKGMVDALGDDGHTVFLTPEEIAHRRTSLAGKFYGIGALLEERDGRPVIVAPFVGSPAEVAGIKSGDVILQVDGEDVSSWSLSEVIDRVRGEEGTRVVLTILRPAEGKELTFAITRGEVRVPAVDWTMVPGTQVALIRLARFSAGSGEEMRAALREARRAGATGLILDVRGNPGGLLSQAIEVTSQFLTEGNVLQREDFEGERRSYAVEPGGLVTDLPLAVLIDAGSASSSEILAGAIQDHERGVLIGETTYGTGTILETFTLDDGSALVLGTSQWLTADGRLIRKQGIAPDVAVALPDSVRPLTPDAFDGMESEDVLSSDDAQLLAALTELHALPAGPSTPSTPVPIEP
ncbi:MAG TPA: S41 family peptidase, partial [Anaerolineae bacterium]|nr:S41 family peptidase [Anaerolineae bacterium]